MRTIITSQGPKKFSGSRENLTMRQKKTLYLFAVIIIGLVGMPGCTQEDPSKQIQVQVLMSKYAITPAEIRAKKGETLKFELITKDVQHGFSIPDLDINEPVNPGKPAHFTYIAAKKGTFKIVCSVMCGSGHDDMLGRLIVE